MKKRNLIIVGTVLFLSFTSINIFAKEKEINYKEKNKLDFYSNIVDDLNNIEIIDSLNLTFEKITNRNGKIIIEKIIGEVTSDSKDGKILNCNGKNNYISYKSVEDAKAGNIILTYYIYNPDSNYEDDVLLRFDYIIDSKEK